MPEGKYFFVRSQLSGRVLDVKGSSSDPDTPVVMYDEHGGDNQLWYVDHFTNTIRSKLNDHVLELNEDNRLVLNEYKGDEGDASFNQRWIVGDERIEHCQFRQRCFDVCANNPDNGAEVCTWEFHGGDNQKWSFDYQEPQYFMILSTMNGKAVDVKGGNVEPGAKVIMWDKHGGDNQLWYEDKYGVFRTKVGDYALDITKEPGHAVRIGEFKVGLTKQMWGYKDETMSNFARRDYCLDIKGCEDCDGAKIICWEYHGNDNQKWELEYVD